MKKDANDETKIAAATALATSTTIVTAIATAARTIKARRRSTTTQ